MISASPFLRTPMPVSSLFTAAEQIRTTTATKNSTKFAKHKQTRSLRTREHSEAQPHERLHGHAEHRGARCLRGHRQYVHGHVVCPLLEHQRQARSLRHCESVLRVVVPRGQQRRAAGGAQPKLTLRAARECDAGGTERQTRAHTRGYILMMTRRRRE